MRNRIIDPDDEDNEEEVVTRRQRPRSRQSRTSQSSQGSQGTGATTSRGRRRQIETIEEEDENESTLRPSRGRQIQRQNDEEMRMSQSQGNKSDSISETVLATFALSSKGPIKEGDLKPLLAHGRYRDWQDGLHELNNSLSTAFGLNLVYDGAARSFFLRNDLFEMKSELSEIFENGTLVKHRIDDGIFSRNYKTFADEDEFNDDDKKGLLFTLLASIMMANSVEMGHKNWAVEEEIVKHMCIETFKISDVVVEKLLTGKNPEFVKEGWLRKKEEIVGDHNYLYHYSWGPRAVGTVSTLKVFEKFCMINQTPMLEWGNYEDILKKLDQKNDLYHPR